jgi:hypothetical protein
MSLYVIWEMSVDTIFCLGGGNTMKVIVAQNEDTAPFAPGVGYADCISASLTLPTGKWTVQVTAIANYHNSMLRIMRDGTPGTAYEKGTGGNWVVATLVEVYEELEGGRDYEVSLQAAQTGGGGVDVRKIIAVAMSEN